MFYKEFPNCCTCMIVGDFGEIEDEDSPYYDGDEGESVENIRKFVLGVAHIKHKLAIITDTSTSKQPHVFEALKGLNFKCTRQVEKQQHGDRTLRLWWKSIPELLQESHLNYETQEEYCDFARDRQTR